ncbi:MAG TPA: DUF3048 domain-containing protein [Streptosporangiaceae bacterium]|nr:DUF3048 domain-containing protein [Streptosporangiaceae bacterium]
MRVRRRALIAGIGSAVALLILAGGFFLLTGGKPAAKPAANRHKTPATRLYSPFTGEPVKSLSRELIFKIDNVPQARPPTGLAKADIVYLLPVEGGLSRIFAVFSSHFPPVVGPVRSSRAEDIELLRQFGRPAFAFSGAQPHLLPVVEHARIVDLYAGIAGGYYRDNSRVAPYNLYAKTRQLLAEARGATRAKDIGFRFGPAPPGGKPTSSYSVSYPAAAFTFRWSASQHRWLSLMDGKPALAAGGGQLGGRTVIIQSVVIGASHFRELGIKPPYANTAGSGTAVVLRNGRAYHVAWSRPRADGGTKFTLPDGRRMLFARGQVWVVYKAGPGSAR